MKKIKIINYFVLVTWTLSLIAVIFLLINLINIYHGNQQDMSFEWNIIKYGILMIVIFHLISFVGVRFTLKYATATIQIQKNRKKEEKSLEEKSLKKESSKENLSKKNDFKYEVFDETKNNIIK